MQRKNLSARFSPGALAAAVAAGNLIRARTHDNAMTYDQVAAMATMPLDLQGNMRGKTLDHAYQTHPGLQAMGEKYRTVDSTGALLVGELERLDQTLHMPLAAVTWSRDIGLRSDVTIADEYSSFTLTTFGSAGNLGTGQGGSTGAAGNGKAWIGKSTDQIGGVGVDIGKTPNPLSPWGLEIKFTILELESAAKLGRPIDDQKLQALKLKHQMDIDEQVYVGDTTLNQKGLVNSALVTNVSNVAAGVSGSKLWSQKTPAEILADVNALIMSVWTQSGYSVMPTKILLPPVQFGLISTQLVSGNGSASILKYVLENNVLMTSKGVKLTIQPAKWLVGAGVGGTLGVPGNYDRMVAYTQENQYVRYPMTMLQRTPIQYDSIYHKSTYYCRLGVVEVVYPETIGYRDGI